MTQTIYDAAGGRQAFLALAHAWHARCLADPIVSHAFSHGYHPQHSERLAAYWAEALGGPSDYTASISDELCMSLCAPLPARTGTCPSAPASASRWPSTPPHSRTTGVRDPLEKGRPPRRRRFASYLIVTLNFPATNDRAASGRLR
jgi:hypothetical protein